MRYISSNNVRHHCVMVSSARACVTANQADDPLDLLESSHRHVAPKYGSLLSIAVSNRASENSRGKRCDSLHCKFPTSSFNGGESWRPPHFRGRWDPTWLISVSFYVNAVFVFWFLALDYHHPPMYQSLHHRYICLLVKRNCLVGGIRDHPRNSSFLCFVS